MLVLLEIHRRLLGRTRLSSRAANHSIEEHNSIECINAAHFWENIRQRMRIKSCDPMLDISQCRMHLRLSCLGSGGASDRYTTDIIAQRNSPPRDIRNARERSSGDARVVEEQTLTS